MRLPGSRSELRQNHHVGAFSKGRVRSRVPLIRYYFSGHYESGLAEGSMTIEVESRFSANDSSDNQLLSIRRKCRIGKPTIPLESSQSFAHK